MKLDRGCRDSFSTSNRDYPRIQILAIEELLHGASIQMLPHYGIFRQAKRVHEVASEQPELEMVE